MFKYWTIQEKKNKNVYKRDTLDILRLINNEKKISKRTISKQLGFSIGKVNYILNKLKKSRLVKFNNLKINISFKSTKIKINYLYVLTRKGIEEKIFQTNQFLGRASKEYDELKKELEKIKNEKNIYCRH